jgi:hypothetical protein
VAVLETCLRYAVENLHAAEGCCGKKSKGRTDSYDLSHLRGIPRETTRFPGEPAWSAPVRGDTLWLSGRNEMPNLDEIIINTECQNYIYRNASIHLFMGALCFFREAAVSIQGVNDNIV